MNRILIVAFANVASNGMSFFSWPHPPGFERGTFACFGQSWPKRDIPGHRGQPVTREVGARWWHADDLVGVRGSVGRRAAAFTGTPRRCFRRGLGGLPTCARPLGTLLELQQPILPSDRGRGTQPGGGQARERHVAGKQFAGMSIF